MPPAKPMDRAAPTLLPEARAVMVQRWAHLLFLHWIVPAEVLKPLLPPRLELDTFDGQAYVGLVPFTMTGVRPVWAPAVRQLSNFHEINVRTYVHLNGQDPGVWFFSLDAANSVAVRLARAWYRLPYHFARMSMQLEDTGPAGPRIDYQSDRLWPGPLPASAAIEYSVGTEPAAPALPGTLEHFLVERYILYAYARGQLFQGRVHHHPYPVQTAAIHSLEENLIAAATIPRPEAEPLIHYASEVNVRVFPLRKV